MLQAASPQEVRSFILQWLSEGIPRGFGACPFLYEISREYVADGLGLHPRQVTIVGSARIGYSLRPRPEYGRQFGVSSDLDLAAVSEQLFEKCRCSFERWRGDYLAGRVAPRGPDELKYWTDHVSRVPRNIGRGFIDHWTIPFWNQYPEAQAIEEHLYRLERKIRVTRDAPRFTRISLRIYKDWNAFVSQMYLNLRRALDLA